MTSTYPIALSANELIIRAREMTGIDLIDHDVVEPLTIMVQSLNNEAKLHKEGAQAMQARLLKLLCNRLRMQRDFAAHPEIAEQTIKAPIIICGMARTGSTKTQKLLAASGDFNWLPYWQSYHPALLTGTRNESPQARIDDAQTYCQWFDQASPDAKYGHAQEVHEPDEESFMLEQSFRTACFLGWTELPSYLEWLFTQDPTQQFHYLHNQLKYLQWQGLQSQDKHWVLKCPLYFGLEEALLSVFPDARLIMTHRHPKETIPSSCRLLETFHQPFTQAAISYIDYLHGQAAQINQHLIVRKNNQEIQFLDLGFLDIVQSVDHVTQRIYDFCGIKLSAKAKKNILDWNTNNPKNKKGVHKYSLADFKFTEDIINQTFADYLTLIEPLTIKGHI